MKNVFLIGIPELHRTITKHIVTIPDVVIEKNFQQVLGMAKSNEITRLCIFMDAWNCDDYNGNRGQTVAEKIHKIKPDIPILIWEGRKYISEKNLPPLFIVAGKPKPLEYNNELYLSFDHYNDNEEIIKITKQFFEGKLSAEDVPNGECLDMKF